MVRSGLEFQILEETESLNIIAGIKSGELYGFIYCDLYSMQSISDLRKSHIRKRNRDGPGPLQDIYR